MVCCFGEVIGKEGVILVDFVFTVNSIFADIGAGSLVVIIFFLFSLFNDVCVEWLL